MSDNSTLKSHETDWKFDTQLDLLKKEIDAVQAGIAIYGDIQFKVKGWAITIFSAFVLFALDNGGRPVMLVACAVTVLLFWVLDAIYKSFQQVYLDRACQIEMFVNGLYQNGNPSFGEMPIFDMERRFREELTRDKLARSILKSGRLLQIAVLYVAMLALLVGLAVWID